MEVFELKLANGTVVSWTAASGEEAAKRAADCLRETVIAWRAYPVSIQVGGPDNA